jgi:hypothetical protein
MWLLFFQAFYNLFRFDLYFWRGDFQALYNRVRSYPTAHRSHVQDTARICYAVDLACIWYWKEVLCLQRSAAAVCLLRNNGLPAQLIIGAQPMPFKAHAWAESGGRVVNDKPYMQEIYGVLERC